MPRAVPIRTDIPAAELRRRAKVETDGRASRRMLALASALEGASREDAARQAGMDRQSLRARRGLLAASLGRGGGKGLLTFAGFTGSTRQASTACTIGRISAVRRG